MASRPQYEPDIAARTAIISAVVWAVAAGGIAVLTQWRLVWPGIGGGLAPMSYGRLRAVQDNVLLLGFLSTAAFAAVFAILPRLAGIRLHNEILGSTTVVWWALLLLAGAGALALGFSRGRPLAELPSPFALALALFALLVAYNGTLTIVRRRERTLYVSAWYLLAAITALPILLVLGHVSVLEGAGDAIMNGFYRNGMEVLWLVPVGLGIAYYVVPETTGAGISSRRVALVGFWSLALAGGWCGARFGIWGPAPEYLQSIGGAMTVVLLVPVLSAVSNLLASARGHYPLIATDFGFRFTVAGLVALAAWAVAAALSAMGPVAGAVGLTAWDSGVSALLALGVASSFAFALVYHFYPRLVGRGWYSPSLSSAHFWLSLSSVGAWVMTRLGEGLWQAGAASSGAIHAPPIGLRASAFGCAAIFAFAQLVLAWHVHKTARAGEPILLVSGSYATVGTAA
jgi:cytochrome c oxidase cbb3-type subunit 1